MARSAGALGRFVAVAGGVALAVAVAACGGMNGSGAVEASEERSRAAEEPHLVLGDDSAARPVLGARVARALYPPAPASGGEVPADDPLGFRVGADALARLGFRGFFAHHFHPVAGERTLVELFDHPAFREVLARPEIEMYVFTVRSLGPPIGLAAVDGDPATVEPRLAEEGRQMHALALRLLDDPGLAGKTVVLKFWESDWLLVRPSRVGEHAGAARARAFVEWMRVRQAAVARARAERPESPVRVLHAVEVNRVHDGMPRADGAPGLLRAVHLLPRIAPDLVAYSAWDSLNPPKDPAALRARLGAAIDLLLDPPRQLALADALCRAGGPCLPPPATAPPPSLPPGRLFLSEAGAPEAEVGAATAAWKAETTLAVADRRGLLAVFAWELFDAGLDWCAECVAGTARAGTECAAGGCARWLADPATGRPCAERPHPPVSPCRQPGLPHPLAGRGFYLLRPDGSPSGFLAGLRRFVAPEPPRPPRPHLRGGSDGR